METGSWPIIEPSFFLCCVMRCILLVIKLGYISSPQYKYLKLVCGSQIHCYIIYMHVCLLIYVFGCKISQVSLLSHFTWKQKNAKILKLMQLSGNWPELLQMSLALVLVHMTKPLSHCSLKWQMCYSKKWQKSIWSGQKVKNSKKHCPSHQLHWNTLPNHPQVQKWIHFLIC